MSRKQQYKSVRFLYDYKVSLRLSEIAGHQLSNLEEISYAISTAPPLPRGTLPCPARAGSAEPGRKRQMPRRLRPPGSSRFRLTRERLPTRPPYSPQGRRCRCRCCFCFPDSLLPTLPQPPPPPPPPQPQHDRRPRRHYAPPPVARAAPLPRLSLSRAAGLSLFPLGSAPRRGSTGPRRRIEKCGTSRPLR